jgi:hypothetical protein
MRPTERWELIKAKQIVDRASISMLAWVDLGMSSIVEAATCRVVPRHVPATSIVEAF